MSKKILSQISSSTGPISNTIGEEAIVGLFNVRNTNTKKVTTIQHGSVVQYDDDSAREIADLLTQDHEAAVFRTWVTYILLMILVSAAIVALSCLIRNIIKKNKVLKNEIEELEIGYPMIDVRSTRHDRRGNEGIIRGYNTDGNADF